MELTNYADYGKEAMLKVEEALADIKNIYNQLAVVKTKVNGAFNLPLGSVFALIGSYEADGAVKLDGAILNETNYPSFYNYVVSNLALINTCTNEEFEASLSSSGYCEKFVLDEALKTVRIPYASGFTSVAGNGFSPLYIVVKCNET